MSVHHTARSHRAIRWMAAAGIISALAAMQAVCMTAHAEGGVQEGETQQLAETTTVVDSSKFSDLETALRGAAADKKTIIELSGTYMAPKNLGNVALHTNATIEIRVPEKQTATVTRESGSTTTSTLLTAGDNSNTHLTISGDFTYSDSNTQLMYVGAGSELVINGGTYTANHGDGKGGVIYSAGSVTVNGGTFTGNSANANKTGNGGAIYNRGGSVTVNDGIFTGNQALLGGVIYNDGGSVTVNNGLFTTNKAEWDSKTRTSGKGGVIYSDGANTLVTINGGMFGGTPQKDSEGNITVNHGNTANGKGGVLYMEGGALSITGGTFAYNSSSWGGGSNSVGGGAIYAYNVSAVIRGTTNAPVIFQGNKATVSGDAHCGGGAIWIRGNLTIDGATFDGNAYHADKGWLFGGGAIYMTGNNMDGNFPAGSSNSTLTITKATFTNNEVTQSVTDNGGQSGDGGAIFVAWHSVAIIQGTNQDGQESITFTGNKAPRLGGAIYTEEDTVTYMAKALATDNSAGYFGGGLWLCPSGRGMASKGGNMITVGNHADRAADRTANTEFTDKTGTTTNTRPYDESDPDDPSKTAPAAGDDFAIMSPTKAGISNSFELTDTGWLGESGAVTWYEDGTLTKYTDALSFHSTLANGEFKGLSVAESSTRHDSGNPKQRQPGTITSSNHCPTGTNDETCVDNIGVALKAELPAGKNDLAYYQQHAAVLFTKNHADNAGGAFGTNGAVVFATPYSAAWEKIDAQTEVLLADSSWTLSIKQSDLTAKTVGDLTSYATADGLAHPYFQEDIYRVNCPAEATESKIGCWTQKSNPNDTNDPIWEMVITDNMDGDEDAVAGEFVLSNLAGGTFTMTERTAPNGYYRSTKTYTFTTGGNSGYPTVLADGKDELGTSASGISQIGDTPMPSSVAWNKIDTVFNDPVGGTEWTLERNDGTADAANWTTMRYVPESVTAPATWTAVTDEADAATVAIRDCVTEDGCAANAADKAKAAGSFKLESLPAGAYRLKETTIPTEYDASDEVKNRTYTFVIPGPNADEPTSGTDTGVQLVDGVHTVTMALGNQNLFNGETKTNVIGNTPLLGAVAWVKTDATDTGSDPLPGSQWRLDKNAGTAETPDWKTELTVADCAPSDDAGSDTCATATDKDSKAGSLRLENLRWGHYRIVETKAPTDTTCRTWPRHGTSSRSTPTTAMRQPWCSRLPRQRIQKQANY